MTNYFVGTSSEIKKSVSFLQKTGRLFSENGVEAVRFLNDKLVEKNVII